MSRTLILVESPAKAKKINQYLGKAFRVQASVGHVCDLPKKEYGVDTDTFEEKFEIYSNKAGVIRDLKNLVNKGGFSNIILATDPDREGEAIAWHLERILKLKGKAERVTFNEITEPEIKRALQKPRQIDMGLVDAQRARRVLDRIVGFDVSKEICWPAGAQSAGRVQTPALHILCEREREILNFKPETFWVVLAEYDEGFGAFVPDTQRNIQDEDEEEEDESKKGRITHLRFFKKEDAEKVLAIGKSNPHVVREVEKKKTNRSPPAPYTTSSMQKDASSKLSISAKKAMDLAQKLYEEGFITYHRTDSPRVSDEGREMAKKYLEKHAPEVVPDSVRQRSAKGRSQEGHEAIRPTKLERNDSPPSEAKALYDLIFARFIASQCKPATFDKTQIWIESGEVEWLAEGSVLIEEGFLKFWGPYARQNDEELPSVKKGQTLSITDCRMDERQTTPPSRFNTGNFITELEKSEIGRPSTFASIIDTLLRRKYAAEVKSRGKKKVLQPTDFGLQVDGLLTEVFADLVSREYTADMEASLDKISEGQGLNRTSYLKNWYSEFRDHMSKAVPKAESYIKEHDLKPTGGVSTEDTEISCNRCGKQNYIKIISSKGTFLKCEACEMTRDEKAQIRKGECQKCGSDLIEKKSKKGKSFWGCIMYGSEKDSCDYGEPFNTAEETEIECDRCGKQNYIVLERKKGKGKFLKCESCSMMRDLKAEIKKGACKKCGSALIKKKIKGGDPFWGCVRYGADQDPCDYSENEGGKTKSKWSREETEKTCPKCTKKKLVILTPAEEMKRKPFYACEDRTCGFTLEVGAKKRKEDCPECQHIVIERKKRPTPEQEKSGEEGDSFWACSQYPDCRYTQDIAEETEPVVSN